MRGCSFSPLSRRWGSREQRAESVRLLNGELASAPPLGLGLGLLLLLLLLQDVGYSKGSRERPPR